MRAQRLTLSPLQTGASIRVNDSLQGGSSRFFAEITRLRRIIDLTRKGQPVVFFLDELLNGTNSHDRRIGAEGILKELLERGAIGLITTHDLALTAIADALADPTAREVVGRRVEVTRLEGWEGKRRATRIVTISAPWSVRGEVLLQRFEACAV